MIRKILEIETTIPAGLFLYGSPGTGKTHLAVAAAREYAKKGPSIVLGFKNNLIDFSTANSRHSPVDFWNRISLFLSRYRFVVVDDIPATLNSGNLRILSQLIYEGYKNGNILIFTSNTSPDDIFNQIKRFSATDSNNPDYQQALTDRINTAWQTVELLSEESFRNRKKKWWE